MKDESFWDMFMSFWDMFMRVVYYVYQCFLMVPFALLPAIIDLLFLSRWFPKRSWYAKREAKSPETDTMFDTLMRTGHHGLRLVFFPFIILYAFFTDDAYRDARTVVLYGVGGIIASPFVIVYFVLDMVCFWWCVLAWSTLQNYYKPPWSDTQSMYEQETLLREEKRRSREIEKEMANDSARERQILKILVLGSNIVSTQMISKQLAFGLLSETDAAWTRTYGVYSPQVKEYLLADAKTLVANSHRVGREISEQFWPEADLVEKADSLTDDVAEAIALLWSSNGEIKRTFESAHSSRAFHFREYVPHFFERAREIGKFEYVPSAIDVLRLEMQINNVIEGSFMMDFNECSVISVIGQRNERKKWIHMFEEVTAVLFVASLADYDVFLDEDKDSNAMVNALQMFGQIANSQWFKKTSIMLFLTQKEEFAQKVLDPLFFESCRQAMTCFVRIDAVVYVD